MLNYLFYINMKLKYIHTSANELLPHETMPGKRYNTKAKSVGHFNFFGI